MSISEKRRRQDVFLQLIRMRIGFKSSRISNTAWGRRAALDLRKIVLSIPILLRNWKHFYQSQKRNDFHYERKKRNSRTICWSRPFPETGRRYFISPAPVPAGPLVVSARPY